MTIKELKEKLKDIPDETEVFVPTVSGDYQYGVAYTAKLMELSNFETDENIVAFVIDEQ